MPMLLSLADSLWTAISGYLTVFFGLAALMGCVALAGRLSRPRTRERSPEELPLPVIAAVAAMLADENRKGDRE